MKWEIFKVYNVRQINDKFQYILKLYIKYINELF